MSVELVPSDQGWPVSFDEAGRWVEHSWHRIDVTRATLATFDVSVAEVTGPETAFHVVTLRGFPTPRLAWVAGLAEAERRHLSNGCLLDALDQVGGLVEEIPS